MKNKFKQSCYFLLGATVLAALGLIVLKILKEIFILL